VAGQSLWSLHGRSSPHWWRGVPRQIWCPQSSSVAHGSPGLPARFPASHRNGPRVCHEGPQNWLVGQGAVSLHVEQYPVLQIAEAHSASAMQFSPSS
jgi:hypothetical protein